MVGSGAIGASTAWYLASHGYKVVLIDPLIKKQTTQSQPLNGTTAALGVLMGNIFRRSSGRGWRMRQRSMELWKQWIAMLNTDEYPLTLNKPLIQIARSEVERSLMENLIQNRKDLGVEPLPAHTTTNIDRFFPCNRYGGLISHEDGRINPLQLQRCLLNALKQYNVEQICAKVIKIERGSTTKERRWSLHTSNEKILSKEITIICAAIDSETLIKPLGYSVPIAAVLGQVLTLKLQEDNKDWSGWPAVLCHEGINMIPCGRNQMLLGATLEPGTYADEKILAQMKSMNGNAPHWLKAASVTNHWSGLRGRPTNRTAPILKTLEPGLIMATGHYRNGILLAPASAEWVLEEIRKKENQ